jgi:dynein light intermediate chain
LEYSILAKVCADTILLFDSSDELIRQITINCAERGLLLLRVRDEARMTITAYETLYESSIAYGVRKALVAEQKRIDLDAKLRELAMAKRELQQQVENLKHTIESTQARSIQKREAEEKVHAEEVREKDNLLFFPANKRGHKSVYCFWYLPMSLLCC